MADQIVLDAVDDLLVGFTLCAVLGINEEGEAPADGSNYVSIQQPVANVERMTIGQRFYREQGVIRFVIHTAIGAGRAKNDAIAGNLTGRFRDVRVGRVRFRVPGPATPDPDASQGNFYVTSLPCPYDFTFTG